jgi:dolichol-phosphate mannosyltransferase
MHRPVHPDAATSVEVAPEVISACRAERLQEPDGLVVETVSRRTLVVIPTYNEGMNVGPLLQRILSVDESIEILVIDDGSPDGTGDMVDAVASSTPRVRAIHRPSKLGLGTAYLEGFAYALAGEYDYVIEMDADFSHRPEDIPRLLAAARDADVVIASRNIPGGEVIGWSLVRHAVSKLGSLYARLLLGLPVRDCTAGFKCFRSSALRALDTGTLSSRGYAFQVEMNFACAQAGLEIVEIPVVFPDRTRGQSKMSGAIAAEAGLLVLRLAARRLAAAVHEWFFSWRSPRGERSRLRNRSDPR